MRYRSSNNGLRSEESDFSTSLRPCGEDLVDYEDGFISPESQAYLGNGWLMYTKKKANGLYSQVSRRSRQTTRENRATDTGWLNGVVTLRNKPLQKYVQRGGMRAYEEIAKNTLEKALDPEIVENRR